MIPVQHTAWLGMDWGYLNFSSKDIRNLEDYQATVLDYGLDCELIRYQYTDFTAAVADVADALDAQIVFANVPASIIPAWRRLQLWWLNRRLTSQLCQFIPQPIELPTPAPLIKAAMHETNRA